MELLLREAGFRMVGATAGGDVANRRQIRQRQL
jgi:hypothetical protein